MLSSTYLFRFIKSSWGIYVELTAALVAQINYSLPTIKINEQLHLGLTSLNINLDAYEKQQLILALCNLSAVIAIKSETAEGMVVDVQRLRFVLTDYQPEGLYFALIGWVLQQFELSMPKIEAVFDQETNRYYFRHLDFTELL